MEERADPKEEPMFIRMLGPHYPAPEGELRIISHRGGRGFGPENTLESLRNALEAGVKMVETDIRETADGVLVIHHNPMANSKFIKDYEAAELRQVHPAIPTLQEYLETAFGRCHLDLEAKLLDIHVLARTVAEFSRPDQVMITSFNSSLLVALKEEYPDFKVGWVLRLHHEKEGAIELAVKSGMQLLLPRQGLVDEDFVAQAHREGLLVYTWTVNHPTTLRGLVGQGIDGVITDKYQLMSETWEELRNPASQLADTPITEALS